MESFYKLISLCFSQGSIDGLRRRNDTLTVSKMVVILSEKESQRGNTNQKVRNFVLSSESMALALPLTSCWLGAPAMRRFSSSVGSFAFLSSVGDGPNPLMAA